MIQPSTSRDSETMPELTDYDRKKWESIFLGSADPFAEEELDYEFTDAEDLTSGFSLPRTWSSSSSSCSAFSSSSSSRASSPGRIIDLEYDDYNENQSTLKKITRDFTKLYGIKHDSSHFKKNWKKSADFRGLLKRWRIRSFDRIFAPDNYTRRTPRASGRSTRSEVEVSEISVIVANNLCSISEPGPSLPPPLAPLCVNTAIASVQAGPTEGALVPMQIVPAIPYNPPACDIRISEPNQIIPFVQPLDHQGPVIIPGQSSQMASYPQDMNNLLPPCYVNPPGTYSADGQVAHVSNIMITTTTLPLPPPPPYHSTSVPSTSFGSPFVQPHDVQEIQRLINLVHMETAQDQDVCKPFDTFCKNFLKNENCRDINCHLNHLIPHDFNLTLNNLEFDDLLRCYDYIKTKPVFKIMYPYFAAVASLQRNCDMLLSMIDDVVHIDLGLVNTTMKNIIDCGIQFREALEMIVNRGVSDNLNDHLLMILTTNNLDHWDLILKLFEQRNRQIPALIINNIVNLVVCHISYNREFCQSIYSELFERRGADTKAVPEFLYTSFLKLLIHH